MSIILRDHMLNFLLHISFSANLSTVIFNAKTYHNMTGHEMIFSLHIEVL